MVRTANSVSPVTKSDSAGKKVDAKDKTPAFRPRSPPSLVSASEMLDALERDTRTAREAYLELKNMPDDPDAQIFFCGPHDPKIRLVRVQAPGLKNILCTLCGIGWPKIVSFRTPSRPGRCLECPAPPPDANGVQRRRGPFACHDTRHDEFDAFLSNAYEPKKTAASTSNGETPANGSAPAAPAPVADAAEAAAAVASGSSPTAKVPFTPENVKIFFKALLSAKADRQAEDERKAAGSGTPIKRTNASTAARCAAAAVPSSSKTSAGSAPQSEDDEEEEAPSRSRAISTASSVGTAASDSAPRALAPFPLKRAGLDNTREIEVTLEHFDHEMDTRRMQITDNRLRYSTLAIYFPVLARPNGRLIGLELFDRVTHAWTRFGRYSVLVLKPTHNKIIGRFIHSPALPLEDEVIEISDNDTPPKTRKKRPAGAQAGPSNLKKRRSAHEDKEDDDAFDFFS
ncbi:hypothetical protein AURDEDRAFT_165768 [Auricularia subglabra TFB-10046 SS5]|nr:hypothetical protein AURDEDRAFT_165768 [Auricularia subglabra TFB-10046 SS5]